MGLDLLNLLSGSLQNSCSRLKLVHSRFTLSTIPDPLFGHSIYHSDWDEVPVPGFLRRNCQRIFEIFTGFLEALVDMFPFWQITTT